MCFTIFRNNNGPMLIEKLTPECDPESQLICGKKTLVKILADCQYYPNVMDLSDEEIKKISSDAAYTFGCYDEMFKKKNKK